MALTFVDTDGVLVIPGSTAKWETGPANSGIATTGVVVLVGEAERGPDFTSEADIAANAFGPKQFAAVVSKYGSGPLVDAFKVLGAPSKDPAIRGAPSRVYIVKTNKGTKASAALGAYATLRAKSEGALGNLINVAVSSPSAGKVTVKVARKADGIDETYTFGGDVVLSVGAKTDASPCDFTINATKLTSAGVATKADPLDITLSQFKTLGDLAAFISSKLGWTATVLPAFAQLPTSALDQGTYAAMTAVVGATPATVKKDAYDFNKNLANSRAVEVSVKPTAALPAVTTKPVFLSGGTKGGTTDQNVVDALAKAGSIRGNFVVTLFSRDATADVTDGLTDAASTYTIASVNAALSAHVAAFSQFKKRKPRQGFASYRGSYANSKLAAQTLANLRLAGHFLDVAAVGASGLAWFHPWMGAVIEAGMQAAGFYRPVFNKSIAVSGVKHAAGEFDPSDEDQVEDALLAGLTVIRERDGGGFGFVSDGTTYGADENFVYNSVQAIYVADTIAMTTAQRMERAFVGQSFADVSASAAMSYFKGVMKDLKRLKLITASDDAVEGYKDAVIEIRPPAMLVSAEVKEATGVYFVPIKFLVSQVTQTARA
jgi:hypothetical protein